METYTNSMGETFDPVISAALAHAEKTIPRTKQGEAGTPADTSPDVPAEAVAAEVTKELHIAFRLLTAQVKLLPSKVRIAPALEMAEKAVALAESAVEFSLHSKTTKIELRNFQDLHYAYMVMEYVGDLLPDAVRIADRFFVMQGYARVVPFDPFHDVPSNNDPSVPMYRELRNVVELGI